MSTGLKLALLGAPGVGKGTLAEFLKKKYDLSHISTGDVLRDAIKGGSPVGLKAKSYMDTGELVPDQIVGEIIEEKLRHDDVKERFLLDGYPRTIRQVEILDAVLKKVGSRLDYAFYIFVDEEIIVSRLLDRRICSSCGALYNIKNKPPKAAGICDECSGKLIQRKDDHESVIRERLSVYRKETYPIVDLYDSRGILVRFDGINGSKDVERQITTFLSEQKR